MKLPNVLRLNRFLLNLKQNTLGTLELDTLNERKNNHHTKPSNALKQLNKKFANMIRVKFDAKENRVLLSFRCKLTETTEREFNLNRDVEETLASTFEKFYSNYTKHVEYKTKKSKQPTPGDEAASTPPDYKSLIQLYDLDNELVDWQTKNKHAWVENYTFKVKDQLFNVCLNVPSLHKVSLPKILIAGMPAVAKIEIDSAEEQHDAIHKHSEFVWYVSETQFNEDDKKLPPGKNKHLKKSFDLSQVKWHLIDQGFAKKMCILDRNTANKLVKVVCIPRDEKREGPAVEVVSSAPVMEPMEMEKMAMFERHKHTQHKIDPNSNLLRVMSYNILANCYSDSYAAKEELFVYCPLEYLHFNYRKVLLIHEIINYNADIIFLQECEREFFDEELISSMPDYLGNFKLKGTNTREGEATLYRSDRFKFVKSHDIILTEELMGNPIFKKLWQNISQNEELKNLLVNRSTILQLTQVESVHNPGCHLLLANTHLFFLPNADFIRLLQAIVCVKYLENLKKSLSNDESIKKLGIIFAGDMNSDYNSFAFKYMFTQQIPFDEIEKENKLCIENCVDELNHKLDLSIYSDFEYTNYVDAFKETIDHLFYETHMFEFDKVIPMPPEEKLKEFTALPNKYIPSDHLAIIFELKMK